MLNFRPSSTLRVTEEEEEEDDDERIAHISSQNTNIKKHSDPQPVVTAAAALTLVSCGVEPVVRSDCSRPQLQSKHLSQLFHTE